MRWPKRARRQLLAGLGALGAGALAALALPPLGWWPLGPLGVALLALVLANNAAPARLALGFAAGAGQFLIALCFVDAFTLVGYLLLAAFEALVVAAASAHALRGGGQLIALGGSLTLAEALRDRWPFGGMPIGGLALGQAGGPLLDLARLGGPLALAGAAVLSGLAVATALSRRDRGGVLIASSLLAAVAALAGLAAAAPAGGAPAGALRVAMVQGGGPHGVGAFEAPGSETFAATLAASEHLRRGEVRLVLWPEDVAAVTSPVRRSAVAAVLGSLARSLDATVVAGVTTLQGAQRFRNELLVLSTSGALVGTYEKVHPVPFGETVPFRSLIGRLVSLAAVPRDMVVGQGDGLLETPAAPLAVLVSYESFYPELGRSGVRAGGELVAVATNTASYANDQVPDEELAASRLQAVATGRDLVQAATTGVSAFVDNDGVVHARTRIGAPALITASVALRRGRTLYDDAGDLPVLIAAALALLAGDGWSIARRKRAN